MASHTAHRPRRGRRRLVVGVAVACVLAVAGVAVAALLLRAPITGGGSSGNVTLAWVPASGATITDATGPAGAPNATFDGSSLAIGFNGALPGGTFTVRARVQTNSSVALRVGAPKFIDSPGVTTTFAPDSEVQEGQGIAPGQFMFWVKLRITFTDDLPLGRTFPAATDAGVIATPAA